MRNKLGVLMICFLAACSEPIPKKIGESGYSNKDSLLIRPEIVTIEPKSCDCVNCCDIYSLIAETFRPK